MKRRLGAMAPVGKPERVNPSIGEALLSELNTLVVDQGYGLKGRSRWIREAVARLPGYDDYPTLIRMCDEPTEKMIPVYLSGDSKLVLAQVMAEMENGLDPVTNPLSKIVATAIHQRILRGF